MYLFKIACLSFFLTFSVDVVSQNLEIKLILDSAAKQTEKDESGRWLLSAKDIQSTSSTVTFHVNGTNKHIFQNEDNPPLVLLGDTIRDLDKINRKYICFSEEGERVFIYVNLASITIEFEGDNYSYIFLNSAKFVSLFK